MRFAFVTRHLNCCGYSCLRSLLDEGLFPCAIILSTNRPAPVSIILRPLSLLFYKFKCWYFRCSPLRMLSSEELLAIEYGITVISIDSFKTQNAYEQILKLDLDLLVVTGWHEKIPTSVLQAPTKGSINVHPSLLPEFRGTSVTRWQVLNGVQTSGVTIHQMDGEFDSGATIAQVSIKVPDNIGPQQLFQMLSDQSGPLLVRVIKSILNSSSLNCNFHKPNKQYQKYFKKWTWDFSTLALDIKDPLLIIARKIIAATQESYEYPGPELRFNGRKFIVREVRTETRKYLDSQFFDHSDKWLIENNFIRWERIGDPTALIITRIQPCDPLYSLRRSDVPSRWIPYNKPIVISSSHP